MNVIIRFVLSFISFIPDSCKRKSILYVYSLRFLDKYKIFIIPQKLSSDILHLLIERASTI